MSIHGDYWWVRWRADGLDWARCAGSGGRVREQGACADFAALPVPPGAPMVLCIPGGQVRVHPVRLPARNRRRFLAALPFALEERLLHDPEQCHYVPLGHGTRDIAVAVVARQALDAWLEAAAAHGYRPQLAVPEFLALAAPPSGVWRLDAAEAPMLLRRPRGAGGAALAGALGAHPPGALLLALEQAAPRPRTLAVRVRDAGQRALVEAWRDALEPFEVELEIESDPRARAASLAGEALPEAGCNLLVGPYRGDAGGLRARVRQFVPLAALAAAVLLTLGAGTILETTRLRGAHQALEAELETQYRELFPEARTLVDPRFQMEQRLAALRAAAATGAPELPLVDWLADLAQVLAAAPDVIVERVAYDGLTLTLSLSVSDHAALAALEQHLTRVARVEVQHAERLEDRVHGRVQMRRPT